jgi:xanthine dehydrogenase accessory factor
VTILLEPMAVPEAVAIFGVGHVGLELARILSRQDIELYLSDSRAENLQGLEALEPSVARIHPRPAVIGEEVLSRLPSGTHVLIMTHDHAEDFALCDTALRLPQLGSIGLIGSSSKWTGFRRRLREAGHTDAVIGRITSPIGLPGIIGKEPAVIAVSVSAALVLLLQQQAAARDAEQGTMSTAAENTAAENTAADDVTVPR